MKKTILFLLVALLNFATMSAQEVKKTIYVIDGKKVETSMVHNSKARLS